MSFRFRPALTWLESRENPSTPTADPFGGAVPPPADPTPAPPPADSSLVQIMINAAAAAASSASTTPPATPTDPLLANNSIYNVPLVP